MSWTRVAHAPLPASSCRLEVTFVVALCFGCQLLVGGHAKRKQQTAECANSKQATTCNLLFAVANSNGRLLRQRRAQLVMSLQLITSSVLALFSALISQPQVSLIYVLTKRDGAQQVREPFHLAPRTAGRRTSLRGE